MTPEAQKSWMEWNELEKISLSDYYDMLERADWTYEMSDDHSVWRRGQAEFGKLQALYKDKPEWKKLYDGFKNHMWSSWKTKPDGSPDYDAGRVVPKPERPKIGGFRTSESSEPGSS